MASRPVANEQARGVRRLVLEKYGAKCACCGETHIEFLEIDHKNSDGRNDRVRLHHRLLNGPLRDDVQVLCSNCNLSFARNGYCPHHPENIRPRPWLTFDYQQERDAKRFAAQKGVTCEAAYEEQIKTDWVIMDFNDALQKRD